MITKPTLILDEDKCRENISVMAAKIRNSHVDFRPHFKTHQSLEIGRWFNEEGVKKITVSSLDMARYFSEEWDDITVAFPVNILEIDTINDLAGRIRLNILVESIDAVRFLAENLKEKVGVFIKIDVGYNRTGISPADTSSIDHILKSAASCATLIFKGFLSHAGHTYKCRKKSDVIAIFKESVSMLKTLKQAYMKRYPGIIASLGDTPGCSIVDVFSGIDELRPGNFVFFDLVQHQIGSNSINRIAVALACPIVAIHKDRNEIVIYGGGVHLSKESLIDEHHGEIFGRIAERKGGSWGDVIPGMVVKNLSQEHGIVAVPDSQLPNYKIGDCLLVLPVHSCMTANLMKSYETTTSKRIARL